MARIWVLRMSQHTALPKAVLRRILLKVLQIRHQRQRDGDHLAILAGARGDVDARARGPPPGLHPQLPGLGKFPRDGRGRPDHHSYMNNPPSRLAMVTPLSADERSRRASRPCPLRRRWYAIGPAEPAG